MNTKFVKRREYFSIVFLIMVMLGLQAKITSSHPPARFLLAYEFETETLSIDIEHPRMYPDIHYIDNIIIWKNDIVVRNETYTSQQGDNYHLYFVINATHMDVFKAFAHCNYAGNATDTITVYDPDKPIPSETTNNLMSIPMYFVTIIIGLTTLTRFAKKRR